MEPICRLSSSLLRSSLLRSLRRSRLISRLGSSCLVSSLLLCGHVCREIIMLPKKKKKKKAPKPPPPPPPPAASSFQRMLVTVPDGELTGGHGAAQRTKTVRVTPMKNQNVNFDIMLDNTFNEKQQAAARAAAARASADLQVQTPAGLMQVVTPTGCGPGDPFEMLVPMVTEAPPAPPPVAMPPPQVANLTNPRASVFAVFHSLDFFLVCLLAGFLICFLGVLADIRKRDTLARKAACELIEEEEAVKKRVEESKNKPSKKAAKKNAAKERQAAKALAKLAPVEEDKEETFDVVDTPSEVQPTPPMVDTGRESHEVLNLSDIGSALCCNDDSSTSVATALQCVICFKNERAVACVPCGHRALCEECGNKEVLRDMKCPMCRAEVMLFMRVWD